MINKKSLLVFFILTFGLTISLTIIARLLGLSLFGAPLLYSQLVILAAMFIPALSAIFTQKVIAKKPLRDLGFKWGPMSMYAKTYLLILLVFIINYVVTWIFFLKPDFTLTALIQQYNINQPLPLPAPMMILIFSAVTFIGAPIFNLLPSMGEELGWRGFLLPNLEPLGKIKAAIISGMVWALWHTPMITILGFAYGPQIWWGASLHFILVTSLGIWFAHIWFKTRSMVLASFMHAVFNANAYGIWAMIFVSANKLLIGAVGLISVLLWLIVGIVVLYKLRQSEKINPL